MAFEFRGYREIAGMTQAQVAEIMGWPTRDGLPIVPPLGEVERGIVEDYGKCDVKWRALIADVARAARSASDAGL